MKRNKALGPRRCVALVTLLMGTWWTGTTTAQTTRDTAQSAAEQRRAEARDTRQREQAVPVPNVRTDGPEATPAPRLPVGESPCFPIQQIELRGAAAQQFAWVLDALNASDGLDGPLRRCLGAAGIGVLLQRAQHAVVARGFVTSRVMVEPQDLQSGRLSLTVVPGRIRQVRFADPSAPHPSARSALAAQPGDLLNLRDIEQALENFKRVPGVDVDIQILPADEPGLSDLVIDWKQGRPVRIQLSVDDSGSRSTGRYQGSTTLSVDNPLALNDLFYVGLQGSLGGGDPGARFTRGISWHYSLPWGRTLLAIDVSRHRYLQTVAGAAQDYAYRGATGSQEATLSWLVHRDATSKTLIESANAIANLPADLNARLNSPDPSVRGEALVDLISLGSGVTAATAEGDDTSGALLDAGGEQDGTRSPADDCRGQGASPQACGHPSPVDLEQTIRLVVEAMRNSLGRLLRT